MDRKKRDVIYHNQKKEEDDSGEAEVREIVLFLLFIVKFKFECLEFLFFLFLGGSVE